MTLEEVKEYFISSYNLKVKTGMSPTNFSNWEKKGKIPIMTQVKLEYLTNGSLKANKDEWDEYQKLDKNDKV